MPSRTRASFAETVRKASEKNAKTGGELQAAMNKALLLLGDKAKRLIVETLLECFAQLQAGTPVDTGRAQAGWLISGEGSAVGFVPGEGQATYSASVPNEASLIRSDIIYVINNVHYVLYLEAGWSRKQPGGFIAKFLADAKRKLDEACAFMSSVR